ncbi:MAG: S41 family peptidase [Anaerolineae bacterium]
MKKFAKIVLFVISLFILTTTAFGAGLLVGNSDFLKPGVVRAADQPPQFEVFWQVWNIVQEHFIDRQALDPTQLTYGAINGLITSLGDEGHTRFLTPEEMKDQETSISGKFYGIGAHVGVKDGLPVIVAPFEGSPADKAGVKAGDVIIEVNGEDVTSLPLNEVVDRIRGEAGTEVTVAIFRPDENKSLEFKIVRAEINIPAATWAMVPGTEVALVRLNQFSDNLKDELVKALEAAEKVGAKQLVVDVRNNPGGLLDQAIKVTSQFVKDGNVLLQEDAQGKREPFAVEPGGVATDIPIVVLINRGSASAAEIFAGAIQDHQRGQIVGETTFGTGTVLKPFKLDDGSGLLLGTSQWLTPEGRLIRKHGIEPDVEVKLPIGANFLTPIELKDLTKEDLLKSEDTQVLKALELLKAIPEGTVDRVQAESETVN